MTVDRNFWFMYNGIVLMTSKYAYLPANSSSERVLKEMRLPCKLITFETVIQRSAWQQLPISILDAFRGGVYVAKLPEDKFQQLESE